MLKKDFNRRLRLFPTDKKYYRQLASAIGVSENKIHRLYSVIGSAELKELLRTSDYRHFLGFNEDVRYRINLHIHTQASDGLFTPHELLETALQEIEFQKLDFAVIAVTDHDTLESAKEILYLLSRDPERYKCLRVALGCELSAAVMDERLRLPVDFELLYYGLNPFDEKLNLLLETLHLARRQALPEVMRRLSLRFPQELFSCEEILSGKANLTKGLGCNFPYEVYAYCRWKLGRSDYDLKDYIFGLDKLDSADRPLVLHQRLQDILAVVDKSGYGFLSLAHPPRIILDRRLTSEFIEKSYAENQDPGRNYLRWFIEELSRSGVTALEIYYGNFSGELQTAFHKIMNGENAKGEVGAWIQNIITGGDRHYMLRTGGNDSHNLELWHNPFRDLLQAWQQYKGLLSEGYRVLNKEMTIGLPGPCMPPADCRRDTGIGSPYGEGADRVWDFFQGAVHKILLGPGGKTCREAKDSPYVSEKTANPFLLPLEKLVADGYLSQKTLDKIYNCPHNPEDIDFEQVAADYEMVLKEVCLQHGKLSNEDFIEKLAQKYQKDCPYNYIGDIQVKIPQSIVDSHPQAFLPGFTLGTPPDMFSTVARNWNFPVLDPALLFNSDGTLGEAGKILYDIFYQTIASNRGGMRIDHFIGMVNPYVISTDGCYPDGRLYSSPHHPFLGRFTKHSTEEFSEVTEKIILKAAAERGVGTEKIYVEDIGSRPEELDAVMEHCGLGRLLLSQFVEPWEENHLYRLKNARRNDVAALDSHDTASVHAFFFEMGEEKRRQHAMQLAADLRFNYTEDLTAPHQLIRMKWGELLASPACRVQAFFTSFTGQVGRYNQPGNPHKWRLRCRPDFERLYFTNLAKGIAYNPFDAIALAIYARGDAFFAANRELVDCLRQAEARILELAQKLP